MRTKLLSLLMMLVFGVSLQAQDDAKMLRFPTIHGNQVVFSYAGDLYTVGIDGGDVDAAR